MTSSGLQNLPRAPQLAAERLVDYHTMHASLAGAELTAPMAVRQAFRDLVRRLLVEALANVEPILTGAAERLLFPSPRRFLSETQRQRLEGAKAAFVYIDTAASMARLDDGPGLMTESAPLVLNALLCAPVRERETNPGLIRMTPTNWAKEANAFKHPPAAECARLLRHAVHVAAESPEPAIVRAAWLAFTAMTVHPFVDGNGRTARAMFQQVAGGSLDLMVDWGVLEQWSLDRNAYVQALQAGQTAAAYSGDAVDAAPFIDYAIDTSTRGAMLGIARLACLADVHHGIDQQISEVGVSAETADLILRILLERWVDYDDIADVDVGIVRDALRTGLIVEAVAPVGVLTRRERPRRGLVAGGRLADMAHLVRTARFAG